MRRTRSPVAVLLVIASITVLFMVYGPWFDGDRRPKTLCLSNVKQLATATLIYVEDHDQRFPPETWADATSLVRKGNDEILNCPENEGRGGYGYAMNYALVGMVYDWDTMDQTVLIFETEVQARNLVMNLAGRSEAKHPEGFSNVAYCDGSAKAIMKDKRP